MEQFVTTYQKDYTNPSIKTTYESHASHKPGLCDCSKNPSPATAPPPCTNDSPNWSRLGPMGRLLDPKLYPAKTGPYPETETTKFDQPSTYLKKLEEKHPNLYGVLQSAPMKEIIKRVEADRARTTYQVDYPDKIAAGMDEGHSHPCGSTEPQTETDCGPRSRRLKSNQATRDLNCRKRKKKKTCRKGEDSDGPETRLPSWRSEYQDNVGKIGQAILKTKMHHRKKATPSWAKPN